MPTPSERLVYMNGIGRSIKPSHWRAKLRKPRLPSRIMIA